MVQKSKGGKKCRSVVAGKKAKGVMKHNRKSNYKKKVVKKVECCVCMEEIQDIFAISCPWCEFSSGRRELASRLSPVLYGSGRICVASAYNIETRRIKNEPVRALSRGKDSRRP